MPFHFGENAVVSSFSSYNFIYEEHEHTKSPRQEAGRQTVYYCKLFIIYLAVCLIQY